MAVDFSAARTTRDLLVEASEGQTPAIEELYRRHKTAAVAYARRRGADDPEAIYDHVFVDVLAKAKHLGNERPNAFVAYLHRSIKNRIIQESRRQRPIITLEGERVDSRNPEPGFEEIVVGSSWVDDAFDQLTEAQRQVMTGRYIEQRSLTDIADRLGKSPSSVRQLHRTALAKLRVVLAIGIVLVVAAAAAWLVRELVATSVDTDPVDQTPDPLTGQPEPGREQGRGRLGSTGSDEQGGSGGADLAGRVILLAPEPIDPPTGATPGPDTAVVDTTSTTTPPISSSVGSPSTAGPDGGGEPNGGGPTSPEGAPGGTDPGATTPTSVPTEPPPVTIAEPSPPAAPPLGGLLVHDPFTEPGYDAFGFAPDSAWTIGSGEAELRPTEAGLTYTDELGQRLVTGAGALQVVGPAGGAGLNRPLESMPDGEYGYAVSFLLRVDSSTDGRAFWTPGADHRGGAGLQQRSATVTLVDGPGSGVAVEPGATVLVVVQVVGGRTSLWVNPRLDQPGQPAAVGEGPTTDPADASFLFGGGQGVAYTIDEFRIGSTVGDVLPYTGY